jgi:histidinol-phosphate aminotransferase
MTYAPPTDLLRHHGDESVRAAGRAAADLAVNVRPDTPPAWLRDELAAVDLAAYPDPGPAVDALAERHGRHPGEVLPTAGAAEAFTLIARAFAPTHPVVVHPQFTEPELALHAAGYAVDRVVLPAPFTLAPHQVPDDADLVVVGNPTNPTSIAHPADVITALIKPGRLVVVDEAFADCVPGEATSLAARPDLTGLVIVRSLTKTWGLAGLRTGYVLAEPSVVTRLAAVQPHWSVSSPALVACVACSRPDSLADVARWASDLTARRDHLIDQLAAQPGIAVVPDAAASFLLVRTDRPAIWEPLRERGFVVRRGDTFPGLGAQWIRVAVRDRKTSDAFASALVECGSQERP